VAADFRLGYVKVEDSAGAIDKLLLTGNLTLLGGTHDSSTVTVVSVEPHTLVAGEVARLTVHGENFAPGASVSLQADDLTLPASQVDVLDGQTLQASVAVPDTTFAAPLGVHVVLADGRTADLPSAVSAGELWWGLWVDSATVVSGKVGSGDPFYRSMREASRPSAVLQSEVALTGDCHNVPFCTVPFNATGQWSPSVTGPMPPQCAKQKTSTSDTYLTYYFCYSGPCTPDNENKVVNLPLALELHGRQLTGGHCHADVNRPTGSPASGVVVNGNTGPDGMGFVIHHIWPDVGGAISGVLYTTSQDTFVINAAKDTTHIFCILQPGLIHMPDGPGYELVGATSKHPSGWYAQIEMIRALQALAVTVADSMPGLPLLGYNDMSLTWGGVFDLAGNWGPPHCSHRYGRGVDFRTRNLLPGPMVSNAVARKLRVLIRNAGFADPYKEADHWHLNYTFPR
jgi:hypothetical protein